MLVHAIPPLTLNSLLPVLVTMHIHHIDWKHKVSIISVCWRRRDGRRRDERRGVMGGGGMGRGGMGGEE